MCDGPLNADLFSCVVCSTVQPTRLSQYIGRLVAAVLSKAKRTKRQRKFGRWLSMFLISEHGYLCHVDKRASGCSFLLSRGVPEQAYRPSRRRPQGKTRHGTSAVVVSLPTAKGSGTSRAGRGGSALDMTPLPGRSKIADGAATLSPLGGRGRRLF